METVQRIQDVYRPVDERVKDVKEVERPLTAVEIVAQAGRCSNCGVPFCHGAGCPLGNLVPEFNEAVAAGDIRKGYDIISKTAFFPEFTGRVCPALCESCCTRNLNDDAVMVRQVEKFMIETAFEEGWVSLPTAEPNGKTAAVIGAGPAGLFAAEALRRKGFAVTVYEKHEKPGGLLRYGIPNWKLEKQVIDRRIALLEAAGIKFICNTEIGKDISAEYIHRNFDYTFLAIGTPNARDLKIPGREAEGIYLALDYLHGAEMPDCKDPEKYNAKGKKVLIIGGGVKDAKVFSRWNSCRSRLRLVLPLRRGRIGRTCCAQATHTTKAANVAGMFRPSSLLSRTVTWPVSKLSVSNGTCLRSASRSSRMKFRILRKSSKLIWSCSPWALQAFRLKAS